MTTLLQRAKEIWPGLNTQEISLVLWAFTTYPEGDPDEILNTLKEAYNKCSGDLLQGLYQADEERQRQLTTLRPG